MIDDYLSFLAEYDVAGSKTQTVNGELKFVLQGVFLILFLKHAQLLMDPVQNVGALKAAASSVTAHHDGAEAAHQNRGPVQDKLLWHRLATRCPVTAARTSTPF